MCTCGIGLSKMGMGPRVSWHIGVASWLAQLLDAVVLVSALWVYIVKVSLTYPLTHALSLSNETR